MQKVLLKKQFLELFAYCFQNRKTGKRRANAGIILFIALYAFLFALLGFIFYFVAESMAPLIDMGMGWLYGAILGIVALLFGTLGSAFSTYAGLYQAKDNDTLLAMPIPPRRILIARAAGVAVMGFLYEALVMIPALAASIGHGVCGAAIPCGIVLFLALGVLVTALSCLLGWLVALLSARFKNKNALTVIFSLILIGVYYYYCSKMTEGIQSLLANSEQVGESVRSNLHFFYLLGKAWMGDWGALAIFTLICLAVMALVWLALTRTFLGITTKKESGKKASYREENLRDHSVPRALFKKELSRFTHSSTYMLNCGLGVVMMLAAAVLLCIYSGKVREVVTSFPPEVSGLIAVVFTAIVCCVAAMNDATAPSVSLEGKSIYILQTVPVDTWEILKAKLRLQEVLTLPPACLLAVCGAVVMQFTLSDTLLVLCIVIFFVLATARLGLILNLKMPSLNWTNETLPIKQGGAVVIALFGAILLSIGLGVGGYFLSEQMDGVWVLVLMALILALGTLAEELWLRKRGTAIFLAL